MTPALELAGEFAAEALSILSKKYEGESRPGDAAIFPSVMIQGPAGKR